MISGTDFQFSDPKILGHLGQLRKKPVASPTEISEIQAECESGRALCLECTDCLVVISVRPFGDDLELFVWIAVAFEYGAYLRQEAALLKIARDLGAKTIAFQSRRDGWGRRLGPEWARRGTSEFVRPVQ